MDGPGLRRTPRLALDRLLLVALSPAALVVILAGPFVQIGVAQLGLPASVVGGLVALQMATAALRPWFGRLGDRQPRGSAGRLQWLRRALLAQWLTMPLLLLGLLELGHAWPGLGIGGRCLAVAGEALLVLVIGFANQLTQTMQGSLLLEAVAVDRRPGVVRQLWLSLNLFTLLASLLSSALLRRLAGLDLRGQLLAVWLLWAVLLAVVLPQVLARRPAPAAAGGGSQTVAAAEADAGTRTGTGTGTEPRLPRQQLDRRLLSVLLLAHAPLYCQEVLLDPWATRLFGWPLAATTSLIGFWALGTVLGQAWALRRPVRPERACLLVALIHGLLAGRAPLAPLQSLPIPLLVISLGIGSGWLQLWLAGQLGRRCVGRRLGETVGWLGAAVVVSRSVGAAVAGGLLDSGGALFGVQSAGAFGLAFSLVALVLLAGAWRCRRLAA